MPDSSIDLASLHVGAEEALDAVLEALDDGAGTVLGDDQALAAQQESLRRLAALVAGGAAAAEVLAAIAREVAHVLGSELVALWRNESDATAAVLAAWGDRPHPFEPGSRWPLDGPALAALVSKAASPVRIEDVSRNSGTIATALQEAGIRTAVGAPIIVDGRVWGVMGTYSSIALPERTEDHLAEFTTLIAAAFSNTARRDELARLADEQAALRRVATLVAHAVPAAELFAAVAHEVRELLHADSAHIVRHKGGEPAVIASAPHGAPLPAEGATAPIVVDARPWGELTVSSAHPGEPPLEAFAELVATAISNHEARAEARRLADEQAALRRVATLVAEDVPPAELLGAVAEEAGRLLGADLAGMIRYVSDTTVVAEAAWAAEGVHPAVTGVWSLEGDRLATRILETAHPIREDDWDSVEGPIAAFVRERLGIRSSVGSPIVVEGRVWGALFVHSTTDRPLAPDTELRVENFTELVRTAMSNAQARANADRLADEQSALRRMATLVAQGTPSMEVLAAVAAEVGQLLAVEDTAILRHEDDGTDTVVARWGGAIDTHASVACPIAVEGREWGVLTAARAEPLPADAVSRIAQFAELAATAISNDRARSGLAASRARIVAAADEERRRVVRDLHDGAQQRLVHTILTLQLAREELGQAEAVQLVTEALSQAERATVELRELAHGLLPAVLLHGGLRAGVQELASRMPLPVANHVHVGRVSPAVEATAYFVVAESLTNVAKHAGATRATVSARVEDGTLRVDVRDDGVGGAHPGGSGLLGLADRLAVCDGRLRVESPADGGTQVTAEIPVDA